MPFKSSLTIPSGPWALLFVSDFMRSWKLHESRMHESRTVQPGPSVLVFAFYPSYRGFKFVSCIASREGQVQIFGHAA
jgi:hypothetical protein